jgi:hypothetical protein
VGMYWSFTAFAQTEASSETERSICLVRRDPLVRPERDDGGVLNIPPRNLNGGVV